MPQFRLQGTAFMGFALASRCPFLEYALVRRYYQLPSLTSLAVFEASARHLNFARAAAELNVTRGAVSRQIKALEDEVGMPLFNRESDGILLTPEGEDLYAVLPVASAKPPRPCTGSGQASARSR